MSMIEISDEHELEELLRRSGCKLVVVGFTSGNCGPCRITTPHLEKLCAQMPDINFVKIDVRKADVFVEKFEITGVPAFCFFRNMQMVYKFQGGNIDFLDSKVNELRFRI
ncbi:thioredoxin-like isoform X2 [Hyla sarda]|uniref:thioredoxin-like isoform X2 n=1 Tax=Hyla sarda TaxID=327740 RepID=UPI0024C2CC6E|nr:thioredoxin-like isoform X2 [Hyla sarda]